MDKDKKQPDNLTFFQLFSGKVRDIYAEFKKIIWPDKKTLFKHTVNVIIVCGIIGSIIVVMDVLFSNGYTLFVNLFQS
jgi:preprotein translocase subunit SecE